MAEQASALIDTILQRVRDSGGTAHTRAFTLDLLSRVQTVLNNGLGVVTATASFATVAFRTIYPLASNISAASRIITINDDGRELDWLPNWRDLKNIDVSWSRRLGSQFKLWTPIGRDLFILYPHLQAASTVNVTYITNTTALSLESTTTDLPDQYSPLLEDLVVAIIRAKGRYADLEPTLDELKVRLGISTRKD